MMISDENRTYFTGDMLVSISERIIDSIHSNIDGWAAWQVFGLKKEHVEQEIIERHRKLLDLCDALQYRISEYRKEKNRG